ncbi:MAG: GntR family transcriptional regulator [Bacillota bacterium]
MSIVIRNSPLHKQVKDILIDMINNGKFPDNRLRSEEEMAEALGVSRATIREALFNLQNQGVITKRHGKGNFVHPSAINTKMRIDIYNDFFDLIESSGYEAKLEHTPFVYTVANDLAQKRMGLCSQQEVLSFNRIYYANYNPAILVKVQIPKSYLIIEPDLTVIEKNLKSFILNYCHRDVAHSIDWLKGACNEQVAELFKLNKNIPMLAWEQVYFGLYDEKICFNEIFFNPQYIDMAILVKM